MAQDQTPAEDGGAHRPRSAEPQNTARPATELPSADRDATLVKLPDTPPESNRPVRAGIEPTNENVPADWEPGMEFLDYKVEAELGRGSFGTVHKVRHKGWNVDMAVKSALVHVPEEDIVREAEVWMELGLHPNIVSCYFVRTLGGIPRIFVEYVDGGTLHEWLYGKRKRDDDGNETVIEPPRELMRAQRLGIAIEICRGMQHAHTFEWTDRNGTKQVGLVHRDLKPLNILMTAEGVPRVTDFGLVGFGVASAGRTGGNTARGGGESNGASGDASAQSEGTLNKPLAGAMEFRASDGATQLPLVGGIPGTPAYTPPEQWDPHAVTTKSADIYAFGVILYELYCGQRPFELPDQYRYAEGGVKTALFEQLHREQKPPSPASLFPDIDAELSALMLQCLEKDPVGRPGSFRDVNDRIKAIYQRLEGESYDALRPGPKAIELLADSLNNRALSYLEIGQAKRAEDLWGKALAVDPHHPESTYNRGLVLWRSGRMTDDALVGRLEEVRATHGDDWSVEHLLGLVHIERSDAGAAAEVLTKAAKQAPHDTAIHSALETTLAGVGKWGACAGELQDHADRVFSVALSADGQRAMSGGNDATVKLWNVTTGQCFHTLASAGSSVALSANGHLGLSAGQSENVLRLWDVTTGKCVRTIQGLVGRFHSLAMSCDGSLALSNSGGALSRERSLKLWNVATGTCLRSFGPDMGFRGSVALSLDCRLALTGGTSLKLWEIETGDCLRTFTGHTLEVNSVALSSDGLLALSGGEDTTIRLWDTRTGACLRILEGHNSVVHSVALAADGQLALSVGSDRSLRFWSTLTGRCLRTFKTPYFALSAAVSADGRLGIVGGQGNTVTVWRLLPGEPQPYAICRPSGFRELDDRSSRVDRLRTQAEGALASRDACSAYKVILEAMSIPGYARDPSLLNLRRQAGLSGRVCGLADVWRTLQFKAHPGGEIAVALSWDGSRVLSGAWPGDYGGGDRNLRLWDAEDGRCLITFMGHTGHVTCVALSDDGRFALSGGDDRTVKLWDVATGHCLRTLRGHADTVRCVTLSADVRLGLSSSLSDPPRLWDLSTGVCLSKCAARTKGVASVALFPDQRFILCSAPLEGTAWLWDVASGNCARAVGEHGDTVWSVQISPDGQYVLSGGHRTVKVWDVVTGRCVRTLEGHKGSVRSLAVHASGRFAVSGSSDKTVRLWDVSSGKCVQILEGHSDGVTAVGMSSDGCTVVAAGGRDPTVTLWKLVWDYTIREPADWDDGVTCHLRTFLTLHMPFAGVLPRDREPSEEEIRLALTRRGTPAWNDGDLTRLFSELRSRGFGWLRPEGVRKKLDQMAAEWKGPPQLPGEPAPEEQEQREHGEAIELERPEPGPPATAKTAPKTAPLGRGLGPKPNTVPLSPTPEGRKPIDQGILREVMKKHRIDPRRILLAPDGPQKRAAMRKQAAHLHELYEAEVAARKAAAEGKPQAEAVKLNPRVGRNAPCPCGSGKLYKHCHGSGSGAEHQQAGKQTHKPANLQAGGGESPSPAEANTLIKQAIDGKAAVELDKTLVKPPTPSARPPTFVQPIACPRCGKPGAPGTQFCVGCGEPLVPKPPIRTGERSKVANQDRCSCGFENPSGNAFCNHCGKQLGKEATPRCNRCGQIVPDAAKFCVHCGTPLRS